MAERFRWALLPVAILVVFTAPPVHAYLDPGTGSYLFQLLLGSILGSLMVIKIYWRKFREIFARWFGRKPLD